MSISIQHGLDATNLRYTNMGDFGIGFSGVSFKALPHPLRVRQAAFSEDELG